MHPNFALHRLVDCVRPDEKEIHLVHDRFGIVHRALGRALPGSRFLSIGTHRRGTAVAAHSHVDVLALVPTKWVARNPHRMTPTTMIDWMNEHLRYIQFPRAPKIRADNRGVELHFRGVISAVDVIPGFTVRTTDQFPVYALPSESGRWIETNPERHNALFADSDANCAAKLRALSQLIKVWRYAHSPPLEISGLYVDMMLATSDIGLGVKSYGQCTHPARFIRRAGSHRRIGRDRREPVGCFPYASVRCRDRRCR